MNIKEKILKENIDNINSDYREDKLVILINGSGESGKDTLIKQLANYTNLKFTNCSTITPIKQLLHNNNLWDGNKDKDSRKLLHDIKMILDNYNAYTIRYAIHIFTLFIKNFDDNILFIHVGEQENIDLFKKYFSKICNVITLLVLDKMKSYDNIDDKNEDPRFDGKSVDSSKYDYIFTNKTGNERNDYHRFADFITNVFYTKSINVYLVSTDREKDYFNISWFKGDIDMIHSVIYNYISLEELYKRIYDDYIQKDISMDDEITIFFKIMIKKHILHFSKSLIDININDLIKENVGKSKNIAFIINDELMKYLVDHDFVPYLQNKNIRVHLYHTHAVIDKIISDDNEEKTDFVIQTIENSIVG